MQDTHESATGVGKIEAGQINLSGKVVLVTGGGRGIGATISLVLAQAGADIAINYSTSQKEANIKSRQQVGAPRPFARMSATPLSVPLSSARRKRRSVMWIFW